MGQLARRCAAAAAIIAAGGLAVATSAVKSGLPDVQVRDADLVAEVSDLHGSSVSAFYDLVQQEMAGSPDLSPRVLDPGSVLSDADSGAFNSIDTPVLDIDDTTLAQNLTDSLFGTGSVSDAIRDGAITGIPPIDAGAVGGSLPGSEVGSSAQGAAAAAATASAAVADVVPALQSAYQTFTDGVVTAELALNDYLVSAQEQASAQMFGAGSTNSDFANFVFSLSNMGLAGNEESLNNLLGANFDSTAIQNSLLANFNADDMADSQLGTMLGLSPGDFTAALQAVQPESFWDWLSGIFPGFF